MRRPIVALVLVVWALASITRGGSVVRASEPGPVASWLVVPAVVGMLWFAVYSLAVIPRMWKTQPDESRVLAQWVSAVAIYLVGWNAWVLLGAPGWLLGFGALATAVVLLLLVRTALESHTR